MYRASINLDDGFAQLMKQAYDHEGYSINGRIGKLIKDDVNRIFKEAGESGTLHAERTELGMEYTFMDVSPDFVSEQ